MSCMYIAGTFLRVAHFGLRHGKEPTSSVVVVEYCREPGKERATHNPGNVSKIPTPCVERN